MEHIEHLAFIMVYPCMHLDIFEYKWIIIYVFMQTDSPTHSASQINGVAFGNRLSNKENPSCIESLSFGDLSFGNDTNTKGDADPYKSDSDEYKDCK